MLGTEALLFSTPNDPWLVFQSQPKWSSSVPCHLSYKSPCCDKVITFSLKPFREKPIKLLPCKHHNKEAGQ